MIKLFFHRVLVDQYIRDYSDLHDPTYKEFDSFISKCKRKYRFVSSDELVELISNGQKIDSRLIHLSCDDGSASTLLAAEICSKHSVPLTAFVTSQVLEGFVPWFALRVSAIISGNKYVNYNGELYDTQDFNAALSLHNEIKKEVYSYPPQNQHEAAISILQRCGLPYETLDPKFRFLTLEELKTLADYGVEIGSHGATHVALKGLSQHDVQREILSSKYKLEGILGRTVQYFSYPEGIYDFELIRQIQEAGYRAAFAVTVPDGVGSLFAIPRAYIGRDIHQYIKLDVIEPYKRRKDAPLRVVMLTWVPQMSAPYCKLHQLVKEAYPHAITVGRTAEDCDTLKIKYPHVNIIGCDKSTTPIPTQAVQYKPGSIFLSLRKAWQSLSGKMGRHGSWPKLETFLLECDQEYYRSLKINGRGRMLSAILAPSLVYGSRFQMKLAIEVETARNTHFFAPPINPGDCDILFHFLGDLQGLADQIELLEPDVLIQLGWGLVKRPLLAINCWGVLSWHHGMMPHLRGPHTVTWAVARNRKDWFGITLQKLNEGMDTGEIVERRTLEPGTAVDYVDAYLKLDEYSIQMTVEALRGLDEGKNIIESANADAYSGEYKNIFGFTDVLRFRLMHNRFFGGQASLN